MGTLKIGGRLRYYEDAWKQIGTPTYLLEWIQGYEIPFISPPVQELLPCQASFSDSENSLMRKAILELVEKGAVQKCVPVPNQFISPIFLADKSNGNKRFIMNLKKLNKFIDPPHFKLEDHRTLCRLLQPDWYAITCDLTDAYLFVPIAPDHWRYLRFQFEDDMYEFMVVPFGLSIAPYLFSKLQRCITKHLRHQGLILVNYLDDYCVLGQNFKICSEGSATLTAVLRSLGFVINEGKSNLVPTKQFKFLGFIFDSSDMTIGLPPEKRNLIFSFCNALLRRDSCKIRDLAQFIGILVAACPGIEYGWLYTKILEREKSIALSRSHENYNARLHLNSAMHDDIRWWANHIHTSSRQILPDSYDLEIFSDSSRSGWGAWSNGESIHDWWTPDKQSAHINFLELEALFLGLQYFARDLEDVKILLRTDNTTAMAYVNKMGGTKFPHLNFLARQVWQWCENRNILISAAYIASEDNTQADRASRLEISDTEWALHPQAFSTIVSRFGQPEFDLFASKHNAKCSKYFSWLRDPDAVKIDAFTCPWTSLKFYAFPPFSLVLRTLNKILSDKATGVVVVPLWPAQSWYPLFQKMLMDAPIVLSPQPNLLFCPYSHQPHRLATSLSLVVGKLSGRRI